MERKKGVVEICYQVVLIIYKKMHLWKIPVPGRDRVKTDLSRLYPGENQEERITEYYVRKLTMSLMIFFAGILLILFVVLGKSEGNSIKNGWMKRTDSGSGSKDYVIIGKVEDGSQYSFALTVQPRKYRQEELQKLFDAFREELPGLIQDLSVPGALNVVLSHRPSLMEEYGESGADLVFSGHAHGGQVRMPLIGPLFAPDEGALPDYTAGTYLAGETWVVISRGLGNGTPFPRLWNAPELVVVTMRAS